jgi:hypothetical protein
MLPAKRGRDSRTQGGKAMTRNKYEVERSLHRQVGYGAMGFLLALMGSMVPYLS